MKTLSLIVTLAIGGFAVGQDGKPNPGSLWNDRTGNPLLDRTARRAGDVITILISEASVGSISAATTAAKSDSSTIDPLRFFSWLALIPQALNTGATSTNDGKGQTNQTGRLTARVSAVIAKVLPNGTMVVEGTRSVTVNKETQTFKLSGVIRRDDIRPDNTILSEKIAEAEIRMEGKGLLNDRQRRGILTRILEWLF